MTTTIDHRSASPKFTLYFGPTMTTCMVALRDANASLVLHCAVTPGFDAALRFLRRTLTLGDEQAQFLMSHWCDKLARNMGEVIEMGDDTIRWEGWRQWLEPNISLLERTGAEPTNPVLRREAQTLLSAWYYLVAHHLRLHRR